MSNVHSIAIYVLYKAQLTQKTPLNQAAFQQLKKEKQQHLSGELFHSRLKLQIARIPIETTWRNSTER